MMMTAEQQARDMLERMGVDGAQNFSAGELVELANLIEGNAAAVAAERERCAKLCQDLGRIGPEAAYTAGKCAAAIHAG